jgi:hypothetical protein
MKTTKLILLSLATVLAIFLLSCNRKDENPALTAEDIALATEVNKDEEQATSSVDDALESINESLGSFAGGRVINADCGVTVDASRFSTVLGSNQKTIVFTFNSESSCSFRSRKGKVTVVLTKGNQFTEQGAEYEATFEGYATGRAGRTVTITGVQKILNETGGLPRFVITRPNLYQTVKHKVTGDMNIAFSDANASSRTWKINREIEWSNTNGVLSYKVSSSNSIDGYNNVVAWGVNRRGNNFYTQLTLPLTGNSICGRFRPTGGQKTHTIQDANNQKLLTVVSTFLIDNQGCSNGINIQVTNKAGRTRSRTYNY